MQVTGDAGLEVRVPVKAGPHIVGVFCQGNVRALKDFLDRCKEALVLAKQTEIENLNLLVLKLKRMPFGQRSEKMNADIEQLELRLEDLETNQAAIDPLPTQLAVIAVTDKAAKKPARRPLPVELPREVETIAPKQEACPDCGGTLRPLGEDVSEVLEYVPAHFKVIRTVRLKLSCACCSASCGSQHRAAPSTKV
jgi:transposase